MHMKGCAFAGVVAVGRCEWRNENGARGGAGYNVSVGVE
jgi:hypothetical protein